MATGIPIQVLNPNGTITRLNTTDDGELMVSETERENSVWVNYKKNGVGSDTYIILIGMQDANFPHIKQGQQTNRIDITDVGYYLDCAANTAAEISYGVITRIDAVNADIYYFDSVPFLAGASKEVLQSWRKGSPSQVKLDYSLLHGATNNYDLNVAGVNTATALDSPIGSIAPRLGDIIMKYDHTAGSANISFFLFYHAH